MRFLLLLLTFLGSTPALAMYPCLPAPGPLTRCLPSLGMLMTNQQATRYSELTANGTDYAAIRAPASLAAPYTLTLPADDGTASQFLQTDGAGALTWATAGGGGLTVGTTTISGGGANRILFENGSNVLGETSLFNIDGMQNVGIGTTSSGQRLAVKGQFSIIGTGDFLNVFEGNAAQAANIFYTLPIDDGSANDFLQTDGSGLLSWAPVTAPAIGGPLTSATAGSVLFAGTATIEQDNANFFWDNTNNRLGIGTTVPTKSLSVVGSGSGGGINIVHTGSSGAVAFQIDELGNGTSNYGATISLDNAGTGDGLGIFLDNSTTGHHLLLSNDDGDLGLFLPTGITSYDLTLPDTQGAAGSALVNDGTGVLSWVPRVPTYAQYFSTNPGADNCAVTCGVAGEIATGGGCQSSTPTAVGIGQSLPTAVDQWECILTSALSDCTAYVVCVLY